VRIPEFYPEPQRVTAATAENRALRG